MKNLVKIFITILTASSLLSCASYKPILDQNDKYFQAGEEEAQKDINQCSKDAEVYLEKFKADRIKKEAGRKAVIGGVVGAATGFLFRNKAKSLGVGALIGAGIGAGLGALGVVGEDKVKPDHIKQNYVSNCLARKGYQVIGWQ